MTTVDVTTDAAACRGADPALFFPTSARPHEKRQVQAAKSMCNGCPMRKPCLTRAVQLDEWEGIWGGFTGAERRRMRLHAVRLRSLDRRVIDDLIADRPVIVRGKDRPAVVHALTRLGWSQPRIAHALRLDPFSVQLAQATAEEAAMYAAAERRAAQGAHSVTAY
jgi:hypothetical protein